MNSERDFYPPKQYEEIDAHLLSETIEELLNTLSERERIVIKCRIFDNLTLKATGERYQVTRERVRQIEQKGLKKLRHPSKARKLKSFFDPNWIPLEQRKNEQNEIKKFEQAKEEARLERKREKQYMRELFMKQLEIDIQIQKKESPWDFARLFRH